jgi:hypothetical protein
MEKTRSCTHICLNERRDDRISFLTQKKSKDGLNQVGKKACPIAEQDHAPGTHDGQVVELNPFLCYLTSRRAKNPARLFRHDALCHRTLTQLKSLPI